MHATHADRLATAREMLARRDGATRRPPPAWYDQAAAAIGDTHRVLGGDATARPRLTRDAVVLLLATELACRPCPHLRRQGPQPTLARLGDRRLDCRRCATTRVRPRIPDGTCDVCEVDVAGATTAVSAFVGVTLYVGALCAGCKATIDGDGGAP